MHVVVTFTLDQQDYIVLNELDGRCKNVFLADELDVEAGSPALIPGSASGDTYLNERFDMLVFINIPVRLLAPVSQ